MKRILFLLLLTVSVYGQNPSRFAKIQITGNTNSGTATKVNVQEANGEVNTQSINTAFNKNFGLNSGDVVGADNLLNQYSTVPSNWVAQTYTLGSVVFYGGKQWIAKTATAAGDVPSVSSKWEEITFEALANKTTTVDQTIIDGSTNAVSGNAVFNGLATKAPISSVHNPVTIGTANGLSLSTQQLSLGLASSGVTGALSGTDWNTFNGKFNTPSGLTTNYLPKWNGTGFGNSIINDNGTTVAIIGGNKSINFDGATTGTVSVAADGGTLSLFSGTTSGYKTGIDIYGGYLTAIPNTLVFNTSSAERMRITPSGNTLFGKTNDAGDGLVQVNGNITASPAVSPNQVVVKSQLDAVGRPYKVYTALISQSGTNAPVATVLENTLGGTVVWSREGIGAYYATLTNAFVINKTVFNSTNNAYASTTPVYYQGACISTNQCRLITSIGLTPNDSIIGGLLFEIRVYN